MSMRRATEQDLQREGQDAAPRPERLTEFQAAIHSIATVLHTQDGADGFVVDRIKKAGSLGKRTSLKESDADLVIFLRNAKHPELLPPYGSRDVLVRFTTLLKERLPQLEIKRTTKHVVQMRIGATEVDMLVARAFSKDSTTPGRQACAALNHLISMQSPTLDADGQPLSSEDCANLSQAERERLLKAERDMYTVAFTEVSVDWLKQQSEVNKLIRVVKQRVLCSTAPITLKGTLQLKDGRRVKTVNMREHAKRQGITGFLIELLVAYVAQTALSAGSEPTMIGQLHKLHELVANPDKMKVYFPPAKWSKPLPELIADDNPYTAFYTKNALRKREIPLVLGTYFLLTYSACLHTFSLPYSACLLTYGA
jgi:hypothetical protein